MWTFFLLIAAALPGLGQWEHIEVRFAGIGCADCAQSTGGRLERMRGVSKVEMNVEQGRAAVTLAPGNRVRLEQVRDFIEQDGTKVQQASLTGRGVLAQVAGKWVVRLPGQTTDYVLELPPPFVPHEGVTVSFAGKIGAMPGGNAPWTIRVGAIKAVKP